MLLEGIMVTARSWFRWPRSRVLLTTGILKAANFHSHCIWNPAAAPCVSSAGVWLDPPEAPSHLISSWLIIWQVTTFNRPFSCRRKHILVIYLLHSGSSDDTRSPQLPKVHEIQRHHWKPGWGIIKPFTRKLQVNNHIKRNPTNLLFLLKTVY